MVPEILRRLLSLLSAHRAFAPLSRLTFGSTGAILMFHEVQENPDNELRTGCSPEVLDGLVRGLIAAGRNIVALDEALRRIRYRTGGRFIVVTFDDGYRDTFSRARVILERYSAPFTVYVPTGAITRELNAWWLGLRAIFRNTSIVDECNGAEYRRLAERVASRGIRAGSTHRIPGLYNKLCATELLGDHGIRQELLEFVTK
jgi:hypothetical protein